MSISKSTDKKAITKTNDEELENLINLHRTVVKVVGTGGAGNNTITRLSENGIQGIETFAVNTDAQDLLFAKSDNKLIIGKNITKGLGAGSDPQIGEESARENEEELTAFLEGADIVFVTCGLGGGTGTGSAPVIAELAKNLNALTISIVTMPFSDEGVLKEKNAIAGLERLRKSSDTVIVVQNDRLLDLVPDLPISAAFKVADEILVNAVQGITQLVATKGLVNLDFSDIKSVMKGGDTAMIGIGESESENKVHEAVDKAINNPLLDININGAKSTLINIEGDETMTINDARNVMVSIAEKLDSGAKIVWGATINKELKGKLRILIIATGLTAKLKSSSRVSRQNNVDILPTSQKVATASADMREINAGKKQSENDQNDNESEPDVKQKNVFNQIFEDEIKGDLNILKEAMKQLDNKDIDSKVFRNIKNAAVAIKNASQLYSNKHIEDFAKFIGDLFELMLSRKIKFNPAFVSLFYKIPQIIEGMIAGYNIANDDAIQVTKELSVLMDQGNKEFTVKDGKKEFSKSDTNNAGKIVDEDLILEKEDLAKRLKMELN